jgi:hypothetical protein
MHNLPDDIKRIIWEFDRTYHVKYKSCVRQLKDSKKFYKMYKASSYNILRRCDILTFSKFILRKYINHQYSRSLYKWYYSDINYYVRLKKVLTNK